MAALEGEGTGGDRLSGTLMELWGVGPRSRAPWCPHTGLQALEAREAGERSRTKRAQTCP